MAIEDLILKLVEEPRNYDVYGVCKALCSLPPREEYIVRMRFGINCKKQSVTKIAQLVGISRERIYQIEHKVLRKMRHSERRREYIL